MARISEDANRTYYLKLPHREWYINLLSCLPLTLTYKIKVVVNPSWSASTSPSHPCNQPERRYVIKLPRAQPTTTDPAMFGKLWSRGNSQLQGRIFLKHLSTFQNCTLTTYFLPPPATWAIKSELANTDGWWSPQLSTWKTLWSFGVGVRFGRGPLCTKTNLRK